MPPTTWRKYRGIPVESLGQAMAKNRLTTGQGAEMPQWDQFIKLID